MKLYIFIRLRTTFRLFREIKKLEKLELELRELLCNLEELELELLELLCNLEELEPELLELLGNLEELVTLAYGMKAWASLSER